MPLRVYPEDWRDRARDLTAVVLPEPGWPVRRSQLGEGMVDNSGSDPHKPDGRRPLPADKLRQQPHEHDTELPADNSGSNPHKPDADVRCLPTTQAATPTSPTPTSAACRQLGQQIPPAQRRVRWQIESGGEKNLWETFRKGRNAVRGRIGNVLNCGVVVCDLGVDNRLIFNGFGFSDF